MPFIMYDGVYLEGFDEEGEVYRFTTYQRGARRSGVAIEDGAFGQVDAVRNGASRRVDHHGFHGAVLTFGVEHLVSVVDEDADVRVICEDQVGCFGRIQHHIGGVHQEQLASQPRRRHLPLRNVFLVDPDNVSFGLDDAQELTILHVKAFLSLTHVPRVGLGMLRDIIDEGVRQVNGIGQTPLNGQSRKFMEKLTKAAVLVCDIHPAVHTVDGVEPRWNRCIRVEVLVRLKRSAVFGMNRARIGGPLFDGGGVMVDTLDGAHASLGPFFANMSGHRHIKEPHIGAFHHFRSGPGVGLRGCDGKHLNPAKLVELAVGEVGSEPAVDAVAVEENGSLKASFVGHLGNGMEVGLILSKTVSGFNFFKYKKKKGGDPSFSFLFSSLYLFVFVCTNSYSND